MDGRGRDLFRATQDIVENLESYDDPLAAFRELVRCAAPEDLYMVPFLAEGMHTAVFFAEVRRSGITDFEALDPDDLPEQLFLDPAAAPPSR